MNSVGSNYGKRAEKLSHKRQFPNDPKEWVAVSGQTWWRKAAGQRKHACRAGKRLRLPLCCHINSREYPTSQRVQVWTLVQRWPGYPTSKLYCELCCPLIVFFKPVISPLQSSLSASIEPACDSWIYGIASWPKSRLVLCLLQHILKLPIPK